MCADTSVSTRPEETGLEGEMEKMRSMILAVTLGLAADGMGGHCDESNK